MKNRRRERACRKQARIKEWRHDPTRKMRLRLARRVRRAERRQMRADKVAGLGRRCIVTLQTGQGPDLKIRSLSLDMLVESSLDSLRV